MPAASSGPVGDARTQHSIRSIRSRRRKVGFA